MAARVQASSLPLNRDDHDKSRLRKRAEVADRIDALRRGVAQCLANAETVSDTYLKLQWAVRAAELASEVEILERKQRILARLLDRPSTATVKLDRRRMRREGQTC